MPSDARAPAGADYVVTLPSAGLNATFNGNPVVVTETQTPEGTKYKVAGTEIPTTGTLVFRDNTGNTVWTVDIY